MTKHTSFLSSVFIRQIDSLASYYYREISKQYNPITGVEYSEAVVDEIRRTVNLICLNPNLYSSYEFKSSHSELNDKLNKFNWKSTTTKRFHNRLFFIVAKNKIYFSSLYGAGQDIDHMIVEDLDFDELGLKNPLSLNNDSKA